MALQLNPLLNDPDSVLVFRRPIVENPEHRVYSEIAFDLLELMEVELSGEKVAVKPNVTSGEHFADPENGITTHPAFIGGMVDYLRQHGARQDGIYIVEDPRDSDDFNPRHWKGTGYLEIAQTTGAKIRCPNSHYCIKKTVPDPLIYPIRNVSRYATASNSILINVPKMKTYNLGITSLCLKNLMGLDDVFERHYCGQAWRELPGIDNYGGRPKNEWMDADLHRLWQQGLAVRLADLAKVIKPDLNIVEGVVARDGTGFNRGQNYALGMSVAGINPVSVDSVTSYIMGFNPLELVYLQIAHSAGLGNHDLARIQIYLADGDKISPCDDPRTIRTPVPFRVIRDILGDN